MSIFSIAYILALLAKAEVFVAVAGTIWLTNKARVLAYNCAMDVLAIREKYLTQQADFYRGSTMFSIEVEKAQQSIKANRLRLVSTRQQLLAELDQ